MRVAPSAVKRLALASGLPLFQPERLAPSDAERLRATRAEALIVAAYGQLLAPELLGAAPYGAINIHASLLPRWRGAAPIQHALLAGDRETGISIMRMDAGLDTGPVLTRRALPIAPGDDAGSLHDKLAALGAELIIESLAELAASRAQATPQVAAGVTYARKIRPEDALLDWNRPAAELERRIRAYRPSPGAATLVAGERIKVWEANVADDAGAPGTLLAVDDALVVACGAGALAIRRLQRAGGNPVSAAEFARGRVLAPGTRFG